MAKGIIVTGGKRPLRSSLLKYIEEDDFIIGVDSGCNTLYEYNIKPNLILGDFDSIKKEVLDYYKSEKIEYIEFNPEKDYTDTDLGYEKAKEKGYKKIVFFGATGTRVDHTLGNFGILIKALREGINAEIIDENNRVFLTDRSLKLFGDTGETISFHAISDKVINFSVKGAKYSLQNYDMSILEPRAVCNEFLEESIDISFDKGIIMVIFTKE